MAEKEYIERDMFLKIISHKPSSPTTDREDRLINGFISAVKNFPAADAIEQLSNAGSAYGRGWTLGYDAGREENKPRWIPVTERLPEKTNHYLVHVKCGCDGELVSAWEQVAWFCEKFYWEHLHSDEVFEETVTHWMPLPEPPKEE